MGHGTAPHKYFARFLQSEAVLRAVIESPQRIVIFALDRNYRYLAYNQNHARTMHQIWGVDIGVGANMLELIGRDDDRAKAQVNFDRALAGESFTLIEEYGNTERKRRVYEDVYSPVKDEAGNIVGLAVYLTDITEHRQAELELERYRSHLEQLVEQRTRELESAHTQLLHAQKLESLGVLAGGVAHDFNNLLAVVLARAELCLHALPEENSAHTHLSIIRDTAIEARSLTSELLNYAGKGKLALVPVDLNQVVISASQLVRASTNKGIRLEYSLGEDPLPIAGDPTQLRQVLVNLINNAAEAMPTGSGQIEIRTKKLEVTSAMLQDVWGSEISVGPHACLEVVDDGCGISPELRDKLFDPFFTTKLTGRGLGLAAVLGIVKSHGGGIIVESPPGQGTCFRVITPLGQPTTISKENDEPPQSTHQEAHGCLLVVDDETRVRSVISQTLKTAGYSVLEADGGLAALRIFQNHLHEIDAVLLDLAMPDMNGERTLRELKKLKKTIPIILLTAYAEDEFRTRFENGDWASVVAKPFSSKELLGALDSVLSTGADESRTQQSSHES